MRESGGEMIDTETEIDTDMIDMIDMTEEEVIGAEIQREEKESGRRKLLAEDLEMSC